MEGPMTRPKRRSLADILYSFVKDNPTIAAKLAFELGLLGGSVAKGISWKGLKKFPPEFAWTLPRPIQQATIKLLPGKAPSLQPHRTRPKKKQTHRPRPEKENTNGSQKGKRHDDDGNG